MSPLWGLIAILFGALLATFATLARKVAAPRVAMAARVVRALLVRAGVKAVKDSKKVDDGPGSGIDVGSKFVESVT